MPEAYKIAMFVLGVAILGDADCFCQSDSGIGASGWFSVSGGGGNITRFVVTGTDEYALKKGPHLAILRFLVSTEIPLPDPSDQPRPREEELSIAAMYGRTHEFRLGRMLFPFPIALFEPRATEYSVSVAFGISESWTTLRGQPVHYRGLENAGDYEEEHLSSLGIPVEVEITQFTSGSLGFVHRIYYTFGKYRDTWGLLWGVKCSI